MGFIRHTAIVVTCWRDDLTETGIRLAQNLGLLVVYHERPVLNNYRTFVICPNGSKAGWPDAEVWKDKCDAFIVWLDANRYDDGSTALQWIEVQYGDDEETDVSVTLGRNYLQTREE